MIPNGNAIMIYKFGEKRWIQKILDGELSFSCTGAFVFQAKKTGNLIQGDLYEGAFARFLNSNPKINEMYEKLGKDLEIINDGDYSLLRRKSAKLRPIFCAFAYTVEDSLKSNTIVKPGAQKLRFEFDKRMYEGFSNYIESKVVTDLYRFTLLYVQPKPFVDSIKQVLRLKNTPYKMKRVEYIDMKEEFYIELTDNYDELFYKSKDYEYQHEMRICLTGGKFKNIFERYPLRIQKINKKDFYLFYDKIFVEFIADIQQLETDEWKGDEEYVGT